MDDYELLVDLHKGGPRQGPGGDPEIRCQTEARSEMTWSRPFCLTS